MLQLFAAAGAKAPGLFLYVKLGCGDCDIDNCAIYGAPSTWMEFYGP